MDVNENFAARPESEIVESIDSRLCLLVEYAVVEMLVLFCISNSVFFLMTFAKCWILF